MSDESIRPLIQRNSLIIDCDTPIKTIINLLFEHRTTGAPVVDENRKLIGFISEKDCMGKLIQAAYFCDQIPTVNEMMSTNIISVSADDKMLDVAQMMVNSAPKLYPVVENDKCIGVITRGDILQALFKQADHCFK
jgi:predicted transcriptional regulator